MLARAFGIAHAAFIEVVRGDHGRATPHGVELVRLAREHDLPMWRAFGVFLEGLAAAESGAPEGGLEAMRRGAELLREQNILVFDGPQKVTVAEAEARAGDVDRAIAILDEALATCDRTGHRAFEAELRRVRGEMLTQPTRRLLRRRSRPPSRSRNGRERAASNSARPYRSPSSTNPAEAYAVLASALEGFSPMPEMPEIAEAQALLERLA
jgi:adenylate cyclase